MRIIYKILLFRLQLCTIRPIEMNANEICSICRKPNDQMLMLSCVHDPCINCAASSFAEQVHIKGQSPNNFICEICGQETHLDASTVSELNSLAKSFVKMPSSIKVTTQSHVSSKSRTMGTWASPNTKKKQTSSSSVNKKTAYFCKEHSEQEISYYCFSCHMNICPECAIHGKHKDHDVKLIKKALNQVKGDYLQIMNLISASQTSMSKSKDMFLKHIKETNEKSLRDKSLISKQFDTIRNALALRERELLKTVEELNKKNIQTLTNFLQLINLHYEQVSKVKKSIELVLRKDEVLIFQEYKKISELDDKVKDVKKKGDEINGEIVTLNVEYLQQEVKQLNDNIYNFKQNIKKEEVRAPSSAREHRMQKQ